MIFAEPCNRLTHAHIHKHSLVAAHFPNTQVFVPASLLEKTEGVLRPQLLGLSHLSRTTHLQWMLAKRLTSKASLLVTHVAWFLLDTQDSGGAESPVLPFGFKYLSYNRC